jgi:SAM-dependent MidA family methyltransferase
MTGVSSSIEKILRERIATQGPLTYETFVDAVLYDELFGYYRTGKQEREDYITSPEIHAVFGRVVGKYLECVRSLAGAPSFSVVELGGASGGLAKDVLASFAALPPERYFIVEKGPEREEGLIRWVNDIDRIGRQPGLTFVLANEFFDALPFHRVINRAGVLEEIYVGYDQGFFEETGSLSASLGPFLDRYPILLPPGQSTEVTTYGLSILAHLSALLDQACFIVFDYGYHAAEVEEGRFPDGSILGYTARQVRADVFDSLGEADITHHVNFDHLSAMLGDHGWREEGEIEQYRFLFNAGIGEQLARLSMDERLSTKWLLNPEGLGSMISVLAFTKSLPVPLPGFKKGRRG